MYLNIIYIYFKRYLGKRYLTFINDLVVFNFI